MSDWTDLICGLLLTLCVAFVGWVFIQAMSEPWIKVAAEIRAGVK